jgi:hypothetical protein
MHNGRPFPTALGIAMAGDYYHRVGSPSRLEPFADVTTSRDKGAKTRVSKISLLSSLVSIDEEKSPITIQESTNNSIIMMDS